MASNNTHGFNLQTHFLKWRLLNRLDENTVASIKWFRAIDKRMFYCTHDDHLFARGQNNRGQLGIGYRNDVDIPTLMVGLEGQHVVDIVGSENMTLALTQCGRVYAWGWNGHKQLANIREECITRPKYIESLKNIVSIAFGRLHLMALDEHGKMFIWGFNRTGQIGNGNRNTQSDPIQLDMFTTEVITQIECGAFNSMVLGDNGDVFAWGNLFGEHHPTPVKLNVSNQKVKQIACAHTALVSLTQQGQIFIHLDNVTTPQLVQPQHIQFTSVMVIDYDKFNRYLRESLVLANSATNQIYHASVKKEGDKQLIKSSLPPPDVIIQYSSVQVSPFKMTVTNSNLSNEDDEIENHAASITRAIFDFFDREDKSDLVFRFPGGETIHGNRAILSVLSSYMQTHYGAGESDIEVTEYSSSLYRSYIQFLHTGSLPTLTLPDLIDLYGLAHSFGEVKLQGKCVRLLSGLLSVDNCCKLYELSVKYSLEHFKEQVIEFARNNFKQIPSDSFTEIENLLAFIQSIVNNRANVCDSSPVLASKIVTPITSVVLPTWLCPPKP